VLGCIVLPGSFTHDQSNANAAAGRQVEMCASSCELSQQSVLQQPDVQTSASDEDNTSVLSATYTRTRTVKLPKPYDV